MLSNDNQVQKTNATVVFKIKDYDMVGPDDFHQDRSLDKLRTGTYDKPWLEIEIFFTNALIGNMMQDSKQKHDAEKIVLTMIYPLDEYHLLINRQKHSFRAMKPKVAHVSMDEDHASRDCSGINFSFQVRNSYIKYILEDQSDMCLPYTVEGKWKLNFTKEEEIEELLEQEVVDEITHMTKTEKLD